MQKGPNGEYTEALQFQCFQVPRHLSTYAFV